ncbi:GAF domain-containing protein [Streptomyces abyssalis]|uniref:GAF domain-containing protein n=1 Tax=Streptomyces abyssalis TaxID=933944 RepID=UPI00085BE405|nr:GAF domain-containing protein [Streptomyces abyssalis]
METPPPLDAPDGTRTAPPALTPLEDADERGGETSPARGFTELAQRSVACIPGSCAAAVTLTDTAGGPLADSPEGTAAAVTHPDVAELVAAQWESEEGPVPSALESGEPVLTGDVRHETRWPRFRAMALQRGLRASATLPYRHEGAVLTLSVYAFRPQSLAGVVEEKGGELAELAEAIVRNRGRGVEEHLGKLRRPR